MDGLDNINHTEKLEGEDVAFEASTETIKHSSFMAIMVHEYGFALVPAFLILLTVVGGLTYLFYTRLFYHPAPPVAAAMETPAPAMVAFPHNVRVGVANMIGNGVAPESLLFNSPDSFANRLTAIDQHMRAVFHPDGGNVTYQYPGLETGGRRWHFNAEAQLKSAFTVDAINAPNNDIIAYLPDIKAEACTEINKYLEIEGTPQLNNITPEIYEKEMDENYIFPFSGGPVIDGALGEKQGACFIDSTTGRRVFYYLVAAR